MVQAKYLLAGVDERQRGFSRMVELEQQGACCRIVLRYEQTLVSEEAATAQEALAALIMLLHARGYTQLRSRLSFQDERYLGTQEAWVDYPDPEPQKPSSAGVLQRLQHLWRRWVTPSRDA